MKILIFIFIASACCRQENQKLIDAEHILWAMQTLGFENYAQVLITYLIKYREVSSLVFFDRNRTNGISSGVSKRK